MSPYRLSYISWWLQFAAYLNFILCLHNLPISAKSAYLVQSRLSYFGLSAEHFPWFSHHPWFLQRTYFGPLGAYSTADYYHQTWHPSSVQGSRVLPSGNIWERIFHMCTHFMFKVGLQAVLLSCFRCSVDGYLLDWDRLDLWQESCKVPRS